jgi:hypothetical protein
MEFLAASTTHRINLYPIGADSQYLESYRDCLLPFVSKVYSVWIQWCKWYVLFSAFLSLSHQFFIKKLGYMSKINWMKTQALLTGANNYISPQL